MIRPTRRAVLIFAGGLPLALLIVSVAPAAWVFTFDYGVLVLLVIAADALLACPPRRLTAVVETPDRLFIGEAGTITATLTTAGYRRGTRVELLAEQSGELDPATIVTADVPAGTSATAALALLPRRRGRVVVRQLWLRWHGPLALAQFVRRVPVDRSIDVLPNIRGVQAAALQFFAREAIYGTRVLQERGEGTEFDSLKEYVLGLDTRFIDWKHSARHRKLVCKEFRIERNHPVVLAFDTGHLMVEPIDGVPRLDHAISAGLLLAWIALRGGDLVGTYGFDAAVRHYVAPMRGMAALGHLQRATAELTYHHEETNFTLGLAELAVRLRRRALVVLFTDFVDTVTAELLVESVRLVAQRHIVVFASLRDPYLAQTLDRPPEQFQHVAEAVIAADFLRDRRTVFERLERLGVHCLDVPREQFSVGLINRYLMIKQRSLI
ncbi:MAG TPA: DUF58 domain-containing protein [Acetobacteraceae bacterium]|nr:DUF58 domain-containing protein [Acetobacteraceae bacterium]